MGKTTMEDIAREAGVSIATVSRIVNNKGTVKPETRNHVLQIMEKLDFKYKPQSITLDARNDVILMCVPDFSNPFNSPVIEGVQTSAKASNFDVLFIQLNDFDRDIQEILSLIKNTSVSGILILSEAPSNKLLDQLACYCPIVMCSEYAENYGISYVSIDDVAASKKAVNYLISIGCQKIGFLNCNLKFKYSRHREKGYLQALEEAGLPINPSWISHVPYIDYNLAYSNARNILSQENRPDGIFAISDVLAAAVIQAAKNLNLLVPDDVSVVGFDNINLSVIVDPQITTISQPAYNLGFQSCELLLEKIRDSHAPNRQIILDTELIVRQSTKFHT